MKTNLTILSLLLTISLFGQIEIQLENASLEGIANHNSVPNSWFNCGNTEYSSSDIHDAYSDYFKVSNSPKDGDTYVGMVIRADDSWEAIGQWLEHPMRRNVQYQFSIHLALSEKYASLTRTSRSQVINFNQAAVLRIWGGNMECHYGQLLGESIPVTHHDWQEYTFEFEPEQDWEYFMLEAYYDKDFSMKYNGNLLLDNCSSLFPYGTVEVAKITNYDNLSTNELFDLIICCKVDDANLTDTSVMDLVYDSWLFESTSYDVGMRDLVTRLDSNLLNHYYSVYEKLGLNRPIVIMKQTVTLNKKNSNILNEVRFLKNSDDLYQKALITEKIEDKRLNYIRLHRAEIVEFLKMCE